MFQAASENSGPVVPVGRYRLKLTELEDLGMSERYPGTRNIRWHFQLAPAEHPDDWMLDDDGKAYDFWSRTSTKTSPKSRARPYLEALLGRRLNVGEAPDPAALIGRSMLAMIVHIPDEDGNVWARISEEVPPSQYAEPSNGTAAAKANGAGKKAAMSRAEMEDAWKRDLKRAEGLDIDVSNIKGLDPKTLEDETLASMLAELSTRVKAGLAAALA